MLRQFGRTGNPGADRCQQTYLSSLRLPCQGLEALLTEECQAHVQASRAKIWGCPHFASHPHFPETCIYHCPFVALHVEFCRSLKLQPRSFSLPLSLWIMFLRSQSFIGVALWVSTALAGVLNPRDGMLHLSDFESNCSRANTIKGQQALVQCPQ
jgi:hypothetical protein